MCTDPICYDAECKAEYYRWQSRNDAAYAMDVSDYEDE